MMTLPSNKRVTNFRETTWITTATKEHWLLQFIYAATLGEPGFFAERIRMLAESGLPDAMRKSADEEYERRVKGKWDDGNQIEGGQ